MPQKRKYKNPYHQTQSELAEWLSLFARDFNTTQVAAALFERYPGRTTGDSKADHRHAKEAICTVNPNDNRYNAAKWNKRFGRMQANYLRELEKSHRQLAPKAVSALNAAYDMLKSTICSLSPKERISLLPKALLTLSQTAGGITVPPPPADQDCLDEANEAPPAEKPIEESDAIQFLHKFEALDKAHNMLGEGKNFDEITAQTGITEDEMKEKIARDKLEHTVLGMYKNGMKPDEIRQLTNLGYAYIDSIIDNAVNQRIYAFDIRGTDDPDFHKRTRSLLKDDDGDDLGADSDTVTAC